MARRLTSEEIGRLDDAIYRREIQEQLEPTHLGRSISIDVDSG